MKHRFSFFAVLLASLITCLGLCPSAFAQPRGGNLGGGLSSSSESFRVGQTLGDGKGGRVFAKWTQNVRDQEVASVTVSLRRKSGSAGTYVNLRFGSDGTFENGKRVYLKDDRSQTVSWSVGEAANGRPLVLNAYDGEVVVDSVEVRYAGGASVAPTQPSPTNPIPGNPFGGGPKPIPRPNHDYDNDNDDDHHGSFQGNSAPADPGAVAQCRRSYDLRRPQIEISELRPSGGLFSGKYKLRGSLRGNCIEEAGYYENGRLKERIDIPLSDRFQRQEFKIEVRSGHRGEIRAFNTRGDEDSIAIDDEIQSSSSAQGNPFQF